MVWIVAGGRDPEPSISLAGLIAGSVTLAVPLVFGSLSGVLCERVGVVNIAIEGQLLLGAFSAAVVATITGNVYVGLVAAAVAGALVSLVLAVVSIKYLVNQIIVGVVLNVLISGLTSFLFSTLLTADPDGTEQAGPACPRRHSVPVRHPDHRPDPVPPVAGGLPDVRRRDRGLRRPVPHQVGTARAGRGRAPAGGGHGGHQRQPDPVHRTC